MKQRISNKKQALKESCKVIAQRYIDFANEAINNDMQFQEIIGFVAYHNLECIGCAIIFHNNQEPSTAHNKNIMQFITIYKSLHKRMSKPKQGKIPHPGEVLRLALYLSSLRNKFLYPTFNDDIKPPQEQIDYEEAKEITRRVTGIVKDIASNILN